MTKNQDRMQIDIWSDVTCPFCYIGKRRFEEALEKFDHKESVEVVWHSFQLNPTIQYQPDKDLYDYVAELKGQTREWSVKTHEGLIETAKTAGLDYRFDKAKITNSFDAHRVLQLAKIYNLSAALEERFFKAYFTEGELLSDHPTLIRLAGEAGLDTSIVSKVLAGNDYSEAVRKDGETAINLGAKGVPFFVMNGTDALAGAQTSEVFLEVLQKTFIDWKYKNRQADTNLLNGESCNPEGECK